MEQRPAFIERRAISQPAIHGSAFTGRHSGQRTAGVVSQQPKAHGVTGRLKVHGLRGLGTGWGATWRLNPAGLISRRFFQNNQRRLLDGSWRVSSRRRTPSRACARTRGARLKNCVSERRWLPPTVPESFPVDIYPPHPCASTHKSDFLICGCENVAPRAGTQRYHPKENGTPALYQPQPRRPGEPCWLSRFAHSRLTELFAAKNMSAAGDRPCRCDGHQMQPSRLSFRSLPSSAA